MIASVLALSLAGCATNPALQLQSTVGLNTIEGMVAAYGAALAIANAYKSQPLCKTGTTVSITNICAKRSVIVRLQGAERYARAAVNQAVDFAKANPAISPANYVSSAMQAIGAVTAIVNANQPR